MQALAQQEEEKAALAGTLAGLQQSLAEATAELERQRHEATGRHEQQQVGEGGAGTPPGMAQAPPLQTPCSGVPLVAMPCCISSPPLSSCPLPIASSPVPSRGREARGGFRYLCPLPQSLAAELHTLRAQAEAAAEAHEREAKALREQVVAVAKQRDGALREVRPPLPLSLPSCPPKKSSSTP